jgi:hypothetical protein
MSGGFPHLKKKCCREAALRSRKVVGVFGPVSFVTLVLIKLELFLCGAEII